jgi:hypothetical protein
MAISLGAPAMVCAQSEPTDFPPAPSVEIQSSATGSLAGRLTDLHSVPLAGVSVVLRNVATGAETRATTAKNGGFRISEIAAGEYTLEAEDARLGQAQLNRIFVSGGSEARLQAAVAFKPAPPALLVAASPNQLAAPPVMAKTLPLAAHAIPSARPALHPSPTQAPLSAEELARSSALALPHAEAGNSTSAQPSTRAVATNSSTAPALPQQQPSPKVFPLSTLHAPSSTSPSPYPPRLRPEPAVRSPDQARREPPPTMQSALQPALAATLIAALPQRILPEVFPSTPTAVAEGVQAAKRLSLRRTPHIATALLEPAPTASATNTTISAAQLQALPIGGRRWQEFLSDTPATSAAANSSLASFRGNQDAAGISIDGANTQLAFGVAAGIESPAQQAENTDQPDSSNRSWNGGRGFGVSEAAIREVTTVSGNVEAREMRPAGGAAGIRTESGSNALHGQAFVFDRQNNWGAQNPFTTWLQNTGTADVPAFTAVPYTPPDHEIVMGLGLGGRIRRNKLFWFAALDSYHRNNPGLATAKNASEFFYQPEPTSASIELLSAQMGESLKLAYNDYMGVPRSGQTAAGLEQLAALLGPTTRSEAQWTGFGRIDWQATERQRFALEAIGSSWNAPGAGLTRVSAAEGNHSFGSSQASQQWLLARWESYLTSNLLLVTQASASRAILTAKPSAPSGFEQSLLSGNVWGQLPQIAVDSSYGFTIGNLARFGQGSYPDERFYRMQEMLDWVHKKLLVKAGFELDRNYDSVSLLRNQTGTYHYTKVASFISDALAFERFGYTGALDPNHPHNCGATYKLWGSQPCYSYYTQTMGPASWYLSTNDWAGYATAQWQANKYAVFSMGLRWEREQLPSPIAEVDNPNLPLTERLPSLGNNWGPRVSLAVGEGKGRIPVFRLGYGIYYGRTVNATIKTALSETGSLKGDLNFFVRPSDDCQQCAGGAPPFPYVFAAAPTSVVAPSAVEFAQSFHNSEVHQAIAAIEQRLPGHMELTASAMGSLGRRLPIAIDTNLNSPAATETITYNVVDKTGAGPIKASQIKLPFYASWPGSTVTCPYYTPRTNEILPGRPCPDYQQISAIESRANSTYEAAMVRLTHYGKRGLSVYAHYTYAHAMDWNPDGSTLAASNGVLDPANFASEYGTSNLDVRHAAAVTLVYEAPWRLHGAAGRLGNGWTLATIGNFHSGLPYTMHTSGSLPEEFTVSSAAIAGLGPGLNGSGGENRVYGAGSDGISYNLGRNTFRYPNTWKADLRLSKRIGLGERRQLEVMAESFNLFNHQNVTEIETTGYSIENSSSGGNPTLCYLSLNSNGGASCDAASSAGTYSPAFGQPLNINATNFYRERQIQFGLRLRF